MPDNTHEALAEEIADFYAGYGRDAQRIGVETGREIASAVLAWLVAEGWSKTEPDQWEYSWSGDTWVLDQWFPTLQDVQRFKSSGSGRLWIGENGQLVHRRPAGPWEVIPDAG